MRLRSVCLATALGCLFVIPQTAFSQDTYTLNPRNPVVDASDIPGVRVQATRLGPGTMEVSVSEDNPARTGSFTVTVTPPGLVTGQYLFGFIQANPAAVFRVTQLFTGFQSQSLTLSGFATSDRCVSAAASSTTSCTIGQLPLSSQGDLVYLTFVASVRLSGSFSTTREVRGTFSFSFEAPPKDSL